MVTIYSNLFAKKAYYITEGQALERIANGKSKERVIEIRSQLDKGRASKLKANLPSICFSGKFTDERKDEQIIEHSNLIVLDFDHVENLLEKKKQLSELNYCFAVWVSPSGNGLKMLVRIADGSKHREHFKSLQQELPEIDKSGINEARVCFESYDENIFINTKAEVYKKTLKTERVEIKERVEDGHEIFINIMKWLSNRGDAFREGERNIFIFKLASACCRFGMSEESCKIHCDTSILINDNTFSYTECHKSIKSAYKANHGVYGTAVFEKDKLIDKVTRGEIKTPTIDPEIYDLEIKPKDVIFGEDVKINALKIWESGYEGVESTGIVELDEYFKFKKGEITLLSGIGNYGKSSFLKYLLLFKAMKTGGKFAFFSPEDNPAEEFYHDMVEIYLGKNCSNWNYNKPSREAYEAAYDWVSEHIFYIYPKDIAPTPAYIKERFLELIIKQKVCGCVIDPFNQMDNDYSKTGRADKFLETFLSDCTRFAQMNDIIFVIVAHPHKLRKEQGEKNYPCPDVYEIADGAMWNNKMDNIIIYHRPEHQTNPESNLCELHTKKIRRQKTVGKKGILEFEYNRKKRRYIFNGKDYMDELLYNSDMPKGDTIQDLLTQIPLDQVPF